MTKKISIFLAALMVLTLFTAIAMAAVNVEVCPTCNQGEMRDSTVTLLARLRGLSMSQPFISAV